jgi:hypothetical protein
LKTASSKNGDGKTGSHREKLKLDPYLYLSPCMKINSKWIKDFNVKLYNYHGKTTGDIDIGLHLCFKENNYQK